MNKTPDQIMAEIVAATSKQIMDVVRERLVVQKELLNKMEAGSIPLPSKSVRGLLMAELDNQAVQCAVFESKSKSKEVKVLVQECAAWAAEAKLRLNKLFADEGDTSFNSTN